MLSIAICEDEVPMAAHIGELVARHAPQGKISSFQSGEELLRSRCRFDIIFLDIRLAEMNGMELARRLRQKKDTAIIIFLTGLKEYVFDAFEVGAMQYLLKPVDEEKFARTLLHAVERVALEQEEKLQQLHIQTRQRNYTLFLNEVLYFENDRRKLIAHKVPASSEETEKTICFYGTMKKLEQQLGDGFYRCHRGYLVNLSYVSEYSTDSILLTSGERIFLAKDRYADFVRHYMQYLRKGGACHV